MNDIPTINPLDDGGINRIRCMEFNCLFKDAMEVDGDKEFERAADTEIKDKFAGNIDYKDALVWVMIDAFREFKEQGHIIPDKVKNATKEWTGDVGSVSGLLEMKYEVTRNELDVVSAREIIDYLKKEKHLKMSDTKIGRELGALKLVKDDMKVNGKTTRVWKGLKDRYEELLSGYSFKPDGRDGVPKQNGSDGGSYDMDVDDPLETMVGRC